MSETPQDAAMLIQEMRDRIEDLTTIVQILIDKYE